MTSATRDRGCPLRAYPTAMPKRSRPGDEIRCPHCRCWHTYTEGTLYTRQMLIFRRDQGDYYARQFGTQSRHETRATKPDGSLKTLTRFSAPAHTSSPPDGSEGSLDDSHHRHADR